MIDTAVNDTVPRVTPMFWAFRIMVGLGFAMLMLFALAFWSTLKSNRTRHRGLLRWALYMLPAHWIACELGWLDRKSTRLNSSHYCAPRKPPSPRKQKHHYH